MKKGRRLLVAILTMAMTVNAFPCVAFAKDYVPINTLIAETNAENGQAEVLALVNADKAKMVAAAEEYYAMAEDNLNLAKEIVNKSNLMEFCGGALIDVSLTLVDPTSWADLVVGATDSVLYNTLMMAHINTAATYCETGKEYYDKMYSILDKYNGEDITDVNDAIDFYRCASYGSEFVLYGSRMMMPIFDKFIEDDGLSGILLKSLTTSVKDTLLGALYDGFVLEELIDNLKDGKDYIIGINELNDTIKCDPLDLSKIDETVKKMYQLAGLSKPEEDTDNVYGLDDLQDGVDVEIGDYVELGKYYGEPILWRCVDIDENGPLMLSDKILSFKPFDAAGGNTGENGDSSHSRGNDYWENKRYERGSSFWGDSNIRDWLNSKAAAREVEYTCGNIPNDRGVYGGVNSYENESGFLSSDNFRAAELACMAEATNTTVLNDVDNFLAESGTERHSEAYEIDKMVGNYDSAYAMTTKEKMFLLNCKQVEAVYNNLGDYYIGYPTEQAVQNSEYKSNDISVDKPWYYWLRDPMGGYWVAPHVRSVAIDGKVYFSWAYDNIHIGIRPAFYLNEDIETIPEEPDTKDGFSAERDGWSFANAWNSFQFEPDGSKKVDYFIPAERYEEVFGRAYTAVARANEDVYNSMIPHSWSGNCFGMAATALLFYSKDLDWNQYKQLYTNDFQNVNDYYNTTRYDKPEGSLIRYAYAASDYNTEVTKLIERYQIYQESTEHNEFVESEHTSNNLLDDEFWFTEKGTIMNEDNVPILGDIHIHNPEGTYIKDIYEKIYESYESKIPLGISLKWKRFHDGEFENVGHAVVTRTDIEPTKPDKDGWVKVYIYDPNYPASNGALEKQLEQVGVKLKSHYTKEPIYIELNIKNNNTWRYANGAVNSTADVEYIGADINGNIQIKDYDMWIDYLYIRDLRYIPKVFNGTLEFIPNEDDTKITVTKKGNFTIYSLDGKMLCKVGENGNVVIYDKNLTYHPVAGAIEETEEQDNYGYIMLPNNQFMVEYHGGDDISLFGNENVINLRFDSEAKVNVDLGENSVEVVSTEDNKMDIQLSNVFDNDEWTSAYFNGTLAKGDSLNVELSDDDILNAECITDGKSSVDVYSNMEKHEKDKYITTLPEKGIIDDLDLRNDIEYETVAVEKVTLDENEVELKEGETVLLEAEVHPSDASNKNIIWTSDDETVASVDENGNVTANHEGTAVITATTEDGGYTATCVVTVKGTSSGGNSGSSNSSKPSKKSIQIEDTENGTVISDRSKASKGTTVTITATPDAGYALKDLVITDSKGNELDYTDKGDGKFTFKMPASKVTVDAVFEKIAEEKPEVSENPFEDVTKKDWFYGAVLNAFEQKLMNGTSENTFSPLNATTRGMVAMILHNLEGKPEPDGVAPFLDVTSNMYYAKAIAWASENGIVGGYDAQSFGPDDNVTREQLAAMLYRYAKWKGCDMTVKGDLNRFTDQAKISDYAREAVAWAVGEGIISGDDMSRMNPQNFASRAEMASILTRFNEKIAK